VTDVVTLQLPRERDFFGVAYLVLGGLAARLDLTYDVLEDVTTALDQLLEQQEETEDVTVSVRVDDGMLSAVVGPFSGRVAAELHESDERLGLRRVLETMVDGVTLSERNGTQWVELRKATGAGG
jgi:anti-sigma regulatory factor (Ser/Thr protein kinase)